MLFSDLLCQRVETSSDQRRSVEDMSDRHPLKNCHFDSVVNADVVIENKIFIEALTVPSVRLEVREGEGMQGCVLCTVTSNVGGTHPSTPLSLPASLRTRGDVLFSDVALCKPRPSA